jgi:hypothetical protein
VIVTSGADGTVRLWDTAVRPAGARGGPAEAEVERIHSAPGSTRSPVRAPATRLVIGTDAGGVAVTLPG